MNEKESEEEGESCVGETISPSYRYWDARGREFVLDGTKKLFGGSAIGVACVLENDLPDTFEDFGSQEARCS